MPNVTDMIERCARALDPKSWAHRDEDALKREYYERELKGPWNGLPFEEWRDRFVQRSLEGVRAVLLAAREPSEGMVEAGRIQCDLQYGAKAAWLTMIDEALKGDGNG